MHLQTRSGHRGSTAASVFDEWNEDGERWLFVSPHDDDVILGAGLLLLQAVRERLSTTVCVVTDGRMGYCRREQRDTITDIRRAETDTAFGLLGVRELRRLEYPDCDLARHAGRRTVSGAAGGGAAGAGPGGAAGGPGAMEEPDARGEHTGLQNSFTACLRDVRPTRVFVPTDADYHPDHKTVHQELFISLFHASATVWPELGRPLSQVPRIYEMAVYCDFPSPPTLQLSAEPTDLETKVAAVEAFASQEQIGAMVRAVRNAGPFEYFRNVPFSLYDSRHYAELFPPRRPSDGSHTTARGNQSQATE
ncbi:MAG: PIG-L deacetylase family protein [Spirochaetota bacterium]